MEVIGGARDAVIDIKGQRAKRCHVYLESGEEISEIPIRFEARIRSARPGQRIAFERFLLDEQGHIFLSSVVGDRPAAERLQATVRSVTAWDLAMSATQMIAAARQELLG